MLFLKYLKKYKYVKKQAPERFCGSLSLLKNKMSQIFFSSCHCFPSSCCTTPEVELTLLAFALARGSVAKVLSSLCAITDHLDTPYKASSLISSMAAVRQNLLYKYGNETILDPFLHSPKEIHSLESFHMLGFKIIPNHLN